MVFNRLDEFCTFKILASGWGGYRDVHVSGNWVLNVTAATELRFGSKRYISYTTLTMDRGCYSRIRRS